MSYSCVLSWERESEKFEKEVLKSRQRNMKGVSELSCPWGSPSPSPSMRNSEPIGESVRQGMWWRWDLLELFVAAMNPDPRPLNPINGEESRGASTQHWGKLKYVHHPNLRRGEERRVSLIVIILLICSPLEDAEGEETQYRILPASTRTLNNR